MAIAAAPHKIVDYDNPPVVEVVIAIWFSELAGFKSTDFGLLWAEFKKDYPVSTDLPPLIAPDVMSLSMLPDLRRVWFSSESKEDILQVQNNLFIANWTRPSPDTSYRGYKAIMASFEKNLKKFTDFVKKSHGATLQVKKLELKYVNMAMLDKKSSLTDLDNLFFATNFKKIKKNLLPDPNYSNMILSFPMRGENKEAEGNFRFVLNSGIKGDQHMIHWEMQAEKLFPQPQEFTESILDWYNVAREWIVKGFGDLTSDNARKKWGERNAGT